MRYLVVPLIIAAACAGMPDTQAATIFVNTVQDVVANDGQCSLREAITSANLKTASGNSAGECSAGNGNQDTVVVPAGIYASSIAGIDEDNNATGDFDILADVSIQGAGMGSTIIDANHLDRAIDVRFPINVQLTDLSIVNGHALDGNAAGNNNGENGGAGGGIQISGGALSLIASSVHDNSGGAGGDAPLIGASFAGNGGTGGAIVRETPLSVSSRHR
jgi:CSLREA domain-containing protein